MLLLLSNYSIMQGETIFVCVCVDVLVYGCINVCGK